jgi:hypothetical protein
MRKRREGAVDGRDEADEEGRTITTNGRMEEGRRWVAPKTLSSIRNNQPRI